VLFTDQTTVKSTAPTSPANGHHYRSAIQGDVVVYVRGTVRDVGGPLWIRTFSR
jgi:hypothetical protein